ncbi:MAG TPA: N-acetylmuramoyl-L-alanine amidase [Acidobacteriaceae bacterium]|jgi:N-acetylmuramoyl-L-alanine amidase|nr:N-acetylmuramoyl-L-alanine amidase [Acidobacteriaceae bacterium]
MLSPRLHAAHAVASAIAAVLLASPVLAAPSQYGNSRQNGFAHAERLREALEGRPEQQRTRLEYERVLDAYRAIYHADPDSPRADASIDAVAELLAEEGRVFQDDKALHDAIGQYEFLRHQYPGSRYRFSALLTEGEIEQRDLGDSEQARLAYGKFLREYPQNPLGVEARTELKKIQHEESASHRREPGKQGTREASAKRDPGSVGGRSGYIPDDERQTGPSRLKESNLPAPGSGSPDSARLGGRSSAPNLESNYAPMSAPPPPRRGGLPLITGIRHWSAPDYTRVVIDLQKVVQYEAVRVPHPDRIYFDLYGTRLSPELVGHSLEVTDDGFLTRVRVAQPTSSVTRIVLDVNGVSDYSAFFLQGPPRLIIDVHGRRPEAPRQVAENGRVPARRAALAGNELDGLRRPPTRAPQVSGNTSHPDATADVADENSSALSEVDTLNQQPNQLRASRHPTTAPVVSSIVGDPPDGSPSSLHGAPFRKPSPSLRAADDVPPADAGASGISASPPANGRVPNSMVRALGLKINRIVIDAGHGGHDSGTLGPGGLEEKDVVLDVALRLGRLLRQRLGADVIYTRTDDTFIPLETRTAIANQAQADLFISIHGNSSPDIAARGVEVYYLNFTTSADALEVAARENADSDQSIHQLSDLVKKIALDDKISESRAFAEDVDQSLYSGLEAGNPGLKDRGVKKAPFVVLIGANMPSILAEISFLTNPNDAAELRDPAYRQRIASALCRGVSRYVSSLNGVRLAQAGSRTDGSE